MKYYLKHYYFSRSVVSGVMVVEEEEPCCPTPQSNAQGAANQTCSHFLRKGGTFGDLSQEDYQRKHGKGGGLVLYKKKTMVSFDYQFLRILEVGE